MPYAFLSDEWMTAAKDIREKYQDQAPSVPASVKANLNITGVPFGDDPLPAHLDTTSGKLEMDLGHLDAPDATLTMDYATAKTFVVDQDQAAITQAFMGGRVKVQGDLAKLMAMAAAGQAGGADAQAIAGKIADEIKAITE